jgi:cation diffusion facilitator CzcD-associated flavoprotein CzcO
MCGRSYLMSHVDTQRISKHALTDIIRADTELVHAQWLPHRRRWELRTNDGQFTAQHVIFATGVFDVPHIPDIAGLAQFPGDTFHSARWNRAVELEGKRIAVIGSGSSAVQLIPELQALAGKLYVF